MGRCLQLIFVCAALVFCSEQKKLTKERQVIFMHGIFEGVKGWLPFESMVKQHLPDAIVTAVDAYDNLKSVTVPLWEQVHNISAMVNASLTDPNRETMLVCYSQGGLLCRGVLALIPDHNVDTAVFLSCPLAGQYGDTEYVKFFFPHLLKEEAYRLFYNADGQKLNTIPEYWYDPHHLELFRKWSNYLGPIMNQTDKPDPRINVWRESFLKLNRVVLVGGPDDGVITPWQSSHFCAYNEKDEVQPMTEQEWYIQDTFGLKTLNESGKVTVHVKPGEQHLKWQKDPEVFNLAIKPYL